MAPHSGSSALHHDTRPIDGANLHLLRSGSGPPLLLLHGWPEFSFAWEPVINRLAGRFDLIAPDLRGFGDSDKPSTPFGAEDQARDMLGLLDALGLDRVGIVGHDVGGAVMQAMARLAPERVTGLFFFGFVYPGIGARAGTPERLIEIWYQSFHELPLAEHLVGSTPDGVRTYISHFLRHWSHRKNAFDEVLDLYVQNFQKAGNLAGGFAYYRAASAERLAIIKGEAAPLPPILVPTCVRWPEQDPIFPYSWTDRLGETFADLDLAPFPGVGHFPHREDPDRTAAEIADFFTGRS